MVGHPIDRRKGSASARVRASARTPGLQKARQGAAGGGRALSAATPLGPVTAGQCGNLSKRRAYFESVVNHRFESRCCGCAGAVLCSESAPLANANTVGVTAAGLHCAASLHPADRGAWGRHECEEYPALQGRARPAAMRSGTSRTSSPYPLALGGTGQSC